MQEIECLRCGQCCYLELYGERKPCMYLEYKKGEAFCSVYATRLGRHIGSIQGIPLICMIREEQMKSEFAWKKPKKKIDGCPYETK